MKTLYIAEKPSVAAEFARVLGLPDNRRGGYIESGENIVTWCVGHLVTMSYPEKYDEKYRRWSLDTLPFIPQEFRYEIIESARKQFETVSGLLNREDVGCIYICTDSGREGEYIYRLVDQMAGVKDKTRKRVWIDSQTEEEIRRGIREAKDWSAYDNLSASAYLRAKEDYLMGINFSRLLTLKYGNVLASSMKRDRVVISVGRVMTCVLGMTVRREREIRDFVKTPFYRVTAQLGAPGGEQDGPSLEAEWRAVPGSRYAGTPALYKENGFRKKEDAQTLCGILQAAGTAVLIKKEKKKEVKNPPLLYNLAEIQNDCSRRLKISPDETLQIIQELYEKKLVTYPRTDARVLSSAVAKEIDRNLSGLSRLNAEACPGIAGAAAEVLQGDAWKKIGKSRYTNDSMITDHYAIIPTGQGFGALRSLNARSLFVYRMICCRFLQIFRPSAVYEKQNLEFEADGEHLFVSARTCKEEGFLKVEAVLGLAGARNGDGTDADAEADASAAQEALLASLKKGSRLPILSVRIREGETSPPKRYTSGSMILAMENAGQLIEDEELRSMIKGSGIGTSATRAEILKKLENIGYLSVNKKTQVLTPTLLGEMVFVVVDRSIRPLLNPDLTASWEKGLSYVAEGSITPEEYMEKLDAFVSRRVESVRTVNNQSEIRRAYEGVAANYEKGRSQNRRTV